jgi:hypothetical protein
MADKSADIVGDKMSWFVGFVKGYSEAMAYIYLY